MKLTWYFQEWEEVSKNDFYACAALRIEVFVIEQDCPYQDFDWKDQKSIHVFAKNEEGEVVCYSRLVKPGVSYSDPSIGRVVVSPRFRRLSLGVDLMNQSIRYIAQEWKAPLIRISAQVYLSKFYSDLGFKEVGEGYLEDDIPHIEMIWQQK